MAMLKFKVENIKASEHKIIFEQKSLKFEQLNLVGTYNTRWGGQKTCMKQLKHHFFENEHKNKAYEFDVL